MSRSSIRNEPVNPQSQHDEWSDTMDPPAPKSKQ